MYHFRQSIALALFEVDAFKVGTFTLKSGLSSPFYVDLRVLVSFPQLLQAIGKCLLTCAYQGMKTGVVDDDDDNDNSNSNGNNVDYGFDLLCGVPYTALPMATAMSVQSNIGMVMRRKEAKSYGTKKMIEGVFKEGQRVLVVEDLVSECPATVSVRAAMKLIINRGNVTM